MDERIFAKLTRKTTCLDLRSDEFEYHGHQDKNALTTRNTPEVWTEWNALVADNVAHAADATIPSLQSGVFACMRAQALAGCRWALPRISSRLLK